MVYGFAQQSGGFATIESSEGKGTTVSIYLPKTGIKPTATDAPTNQIVLEEGCGETILLVEDEAVVRDATTKLLKRLEYNVLVAEDGTAAIAISSNTDRIDLCSRI
jgi:hypothetical protein